jgi:hypothetical protein
MAQYFLRKNVSFIKLCNPPVNGWSLAVREGVMKALDQVRIDKPDGLVIFGDGFYNFSRILHNNNNYLGRIFLRVLTLRNFRKGSILFVLD